MIVIFFPQVDALFIDDRVGCPASRHSSGPEEGREHNVTVATGCRYACAAL